VVDAEEFILVVVMTEAVVVVDDAVRVVVITEDDNVVGKLPVALAARTDETDVHAAFLFKFLSYKSASP
jgi:hypothetical protein